MFRRIWRTDRYTEERQAVGQAECRPTVNRDPTKVIPSLLIQNYKRNEKYGCGQFFFGYFLAVFEIYISLLYRNSRTLSYYTLLVARYATVLTGNDVTEVNDPTR